METQEIKKHIDRVVGTKGILQVPSWWMHKILNDMIEYLDEKSDISALQALKEDIENHLALISDSVNSLDSRILKLESQELIKVVTELPDEGIANTIYLVALEEGGEDNTLSE